MKDKILSLLDKLPVIEQELGSPDAVKDQKKFKDLTQEHSYLTEVKEKWEEFVHISKQLTDSKEMMQQESDEEFLKMLEDELETLERKHKRLKKEIETLLVPPDPNDNANTIMELRAGTGGDEAAIFVGDCVRMYRVFAEKMGWKSEVLSYAQSEMGGYKEFVMALSGKSVYRFLKHEGGTHRVQRVPVTESQGRVHTSAITIAVLLEPEDDQEVILNDKDLRIDTYRASGAGGQHINTTDSAVRVTHIPTGLVSYCMQEKSQHKNKEKAIRLLKAKIAEFERQKKAFEISDSRSKQVGSGDRSERIRTYNFPQNRLTDHRINLTLYSLDKIMEGELEEVSSALVSHFYQKQLST